ncbi:uncharacterized protein LAESUDRAFT_755381 [Laetiporus sulphureus 93-53]|uniref:Heat shock protein 9/12 n=1 Tax=Laetiporus sulphureus 93-53 TaxID=1314785 RepID=A0A165GR89_9APHY|nr:uncharacterized protein LAESUDRAFT_755381 [Laetiporus sulphureus 93-53]KZT10696.1 hypothetical protein LAESUDRAFT_755381 [Laetiporus sulphureus 93-53]
MSDTGRQSISDKLGAAVKPDSEKSTTEHFGDMIKGKGDSAASSAQPESEKSYTQQLGDTFSSNSNENQSSVMDKAKNAMGMGSNNNNV